MDFVEHVKCHMSEMASASREIPGWRLNVNMEGGIFSEYCIRRKFNLTKTLLNTRGGCKIFTFQA